MRAFSAIIVAQLCLGLTGCESEQFRAETRLLADGSLERIVYQSPDRTRNTGQPESAWTKTRNVPKLESAAQQRRTLREMLPLPDDEFRSPQAKSSKLYWLAMGKFAAARAIPDYLVFEAPPGLPEGRLVRRLERREAGLVTEWIWEETLTDAVTLTDHRLARQEAADIAVSITLAACADAWGPDYDLKQLEHWLRQDLTACFQELCDAVFQHGLTRHRTESHEQDFWNAGAKILSRYGLDLFDAQQQLIQDQQEIAKRVQIFLTANLQRRVRDQQGQPLKEDLLRDAFSTLQTKETEGPQTESRWSQACRRAVLAKYGTNKTFEEQVNRLGVRILGLYVWPLLHVERQFDYRLDVPGYILETNGTLTGDRSVRWKFEASEAFPLGYSMRAVVAVPNTAAWMQHFPRAKLDSREVLVEYLDLVAADAHLRSALNELAQKNDPAAWKAWQIDHLGTTRLFDLLQPSP